MVVGKSYILFLFGICGTFYVFADRVKAACSSNCADNPLNQTSLTCNETSGECLYGCRHNFGGESCQTCARGWTGDHCNISCDYNCQTCTWDKLTGVVDCERCYPEYYYFNKQCETCNIQCQRNTTSELPTCDPTDGTCQFGCINGHYSSLCNNQCSGMCSNKTCDDEGCCTKGCRNEKYGGCRCAEPCNGGCLHEICHQNKTCKNGCVINKWGPDCNSCFMNKWGPDCNESCSENCKETDIYSSCDAESGVCVQGCEKGHYGSHCNLTCSATCLESACFRENGTCVLGCEQGFYGPFCFLPCFGHCSNSTCARKDGTCQSCARGWIGDNCNISCDYNCRTCTLDMLTEEVDCERCYPEYYYLNKQCETCRTQCLRNTSSERPTCDPTDGTCQFGCINGYYSSLCNNQCSGMCVNETCDDDGCCTKGCQDEAYGGCRCVEPCNSGCLHGICHQNKTCIDGCIINKWGPECNDSCSENCREPDNNSSSCDNSGKCTLGCKQNFMGPTCLEQCSETCSGSDCDAESGVCLQGCEKGNYGSHCNLTCSATCLESDCFRENGTCLSGCVEGFYGPFCSLPCFGHCLNFTCSREDGMCQNCPRGWTGDNCNISCDYNCQTCTWDKETDDVGCDRCFPEYYYLNKECETCSNQCLRNKSSEIPACDPDDGTCQFGCINGYYSSQCNNQCSKICVNETCDANGCCTKGCRNEKYGGCRCVEPCNGGCLRGICHQNKTCKDGCVINKWGTDCNDSCSENCKDTNTNLSSCDSSGICILGCKKTFMGPTCSEHCSENCSSTDCNAYSGVCLLGCTKGHYGSHCNLTCSRTCLDFDCFRDNGTCVLGCEQGLHGPFCSLPCPDHCLHSVCFRGNGSCISGCLVGFTGEDCQDYVPPSTPPPAINYQYVGVSSGLLAFSFIALVLVFCLTRKRRSGRIFKYFLSTKEECV